MIVLGLTGSIGMGKSATASIFRNLGVPVHDADRTVHDLMSPGGAAFSDIARTFPDCVVAGRIDRQKLGAHVFGRAESLKKLEAILHPKVRAQENRFLQAQCRAGQKLVVLDIPLLFETGGQKRMDAVCVVTASKFLQKKRVMQRDGMTPEKFSAILKKQMPDFDKRKRADFVIFTGAGFRTARNQVKKIIDCLSRKEASHA